ncbi:hypothetical protein [Corynebacterium caspium]|uniref:hypothetical protein n=1 Tax=Corynebacterium caspium TaxID=234828 RepID=UPI00039FBF03|nr:hypothetical protein [Corynebacterium caspium]
MDAKHWLSLNSGQLITNQFVADVLKITRKTASRRLKTQLSCADLFLLCEHLNINKIYALVELGYIDSSEITGYISSRYLSHQTTSSADSPLIPTSTTYK